MILPSLPVEARPVGHEYRCAILCEGPPRPTPNDPEGKMLIWCYGSSGDGAVRKLRQFITSMIEEKQC